MSSRKCDAFGKKKDVRGGKVCPNGHFIFADCVYGGFFRPTRTSLSNMTEALKMSLGADLDDCGAGHPAGKVSEPFDGGEQWLK